MDNSLTWLHLSDLHCCPERTGWDAERVLRTLRRDLEELAEEHQLRPDLLFFTGDAAYGELAGSPIRKQLTAAGALFEEIRKLCDLPKENVFLVPGNHDVHRGEVSQLHTEWLDKRAQNYALQEIHQLIHRAGREWKSILHRLQAYRNFLEEMSYNHLLEDPDRLIYAARREVRGTEVAIAGLNSAWSCGRDGEKGSLWLGGDWQLAHLEPQLQGAAVVIGLIHHPRGWFVPAEDPDIERLCERIFDFHLHGHEHQAWVKPLADGHVRIAAGAAYERSGRPNGYNLVRLDFENEKAEVWLRAYESDAGAWQQRVIKNKTDAHGVWHLDRLRCFMRSPQPAIVAAPETTTQEATAAPATAPPSKLQQQLLGDIFDALAHNPVLLLLAQQGRVERQTIAAIKQRAAANCGAEAVLHVTPPTSPTADLESYFGWLAGQCGFESTEPTTGQVGPIAWAAALERRLREGERLFLLVNGFERGSSAGRQELGQVLRSLAERYDRALSVVLCGGERLAALKYEDGRMSVLNSAERLDWPEMTVADAIAWQRRDYPDLGLTSRDVEDLFQLSGGHPRLLRSCLEDRRRGRPADDAEAIGDACEELFYSLFRRWQNQPEERQRACALLDQDDLGRHRPWIEEPVLRQLYWQNALVVQGRRLNWRCEGICEVGRRVLACG